MKVAASAKAIYDALCGRFQHFAIGGSPIEPKLPDQRVRGSEESCEVMHGHSGAHVQFIEELPDKESGNAKCGKEESQFAYIAGLCV